MIFRKYIGICSSLAVTLFFLGAPWMASAASFNLAPDKETFVIGDTFNVDVKIESTDVGVNAAQGTITFPKDIVEVTALDKAGSALDFWIQGPDYSNDTGQVTFIGGSQNGISGKALEVLRVTFKVKGAGPVGIIFSDGAVTASDGSGTNVLSAMNGLKLTSITKSDSLLIKAPQIVRPAAPPSGLPAKPAIAVPLYPDPSRWSDVSQRFFVSWKLPPDVTGVAMVLDKVSSSVPDTSEGLFETKEFPPLRDGIYYLHARYENGIGWGPTLHYRIAVDTLPPPSFKIDIDNAASDNPTPKITFHPEDAFSGIARTLISVDNKVILQASSTTVVLPPVLPGLHTLQVKVSDNAGNSAESSLKFEILPIPTPIVEFLPSSASLDEPIFVIGKSTPNVFIDAHVLNATQQEVFKETVQSDASGNWQISIGQSLHIGNYTLLITARDKRGATSYPVKGESFSVHAQTVLSLGGVINLGWFEILLVLVLIIVAGASFIAWRYVSQKNTREAYKIIVGRDIEKLSTLLSDHLKELEDARELHDSGREAKELALIGRMKDTVAKMRKYLGEEVEKLK